MIDPEGAPPRLDAILDRYRAREIASATTLMQLILAADRPGQVRDAIATDTAFEPLRQLWDGDPALWNRLKGVFETEQAITDGSRTGVVERWADVFDRAVRVSPEASVAAYSLGQPRLLQDATNEVVTLLGGWGLLNPAARVLELGCGIGRFAEALAPEVSHYLGVDVSGGMVDEARRRCAGLPNVRIEQTNGRNLVACHARSATLVLAADVFPYLVEDDLLLARVHFREISRVLGAVGECTLINFSYRGDDDADREDVTTLAGESGLQVVVNGVRPFATWDGLLFRLRRI